MFKHTCLKVADELNTMSSPETKTKRGDTFISNMFDAVSRLSTLIIHQHYQDDTDVFRLLTLFILFIVCQKLPKKKRNNLYLWITAIGGASKRLLLKLLRT